jgi:hypothetical protein
MLPAAFSHRATLNILAMGTEPVSVGSKWWAGKNKRFACALAAALLNGLLDHRRVRPGAVRGEISFTIYRYGLRFYPGNDAAEMH